jgi:hypothetical protein
MKKIFSFFILTVLLLSCNSGNDPEEAAENFFTAMQQKNYSEAEKYATSESENVLKMLAMFSKYNEAVSSDEKIIVSNVRINGNDATAEIRPEDQAIGMVAKLKKEDGEWKVAFDLNSIKKMFGVMSAGENANGNTDNVIDSIKSGMNEANKVYDSASQELQQINH